MPGITSVEKDYVRRWVDDLNEFEHDARIVYENGTESSKKHIEWNERSSSFRCGDTFDTTEINSGSLELIDATFEDLTDAMVCTTVTENLSESVEKRLRDLGYA